MRAETSGDQLPLWRRPLLATTLPRRWTRDLLWQRILRSSLGTPSALCPPPMGASFGISTELCSASDLKTCPARAGAGTCRGTLGQSARMCPSIAPDAGGRRARGCLSLTLPEGCRRRACGRLGIALPLMPVGRKQQCWGTSGWSPSGAPVACLRLPSAAGGITPTSLHGSACCCPVPNLPGSSLSRLWASFLSLWPFLYPPETGCSLGLCEISLRCYLCEGKESLSILS